MSVEENQEVEDFIEENLDEENINEVVEEELNEPPIEDDEVVERAKKYGHLSKEEWIAAGRNPAEWKSPEEFDKTGKVIEQLYSLKKKVDERDRQIESLVKYQERTAQREYERAKQELEQQLANSKNDMDMEGVSHYTRELVKLQDNETSSKVHQATQLQQAAQQAFIERNQHWFNDRNPDLKKRAIEIDNEIKDLYPNATHEELGQIIERRMEYDYPERILGAKQSARPSISSSGQSSINKTAIVKKHVLKNLSQEHKDTYNVYKRINPKITEADFIQKLKNDGELE